MRIFNARISSHTEGIATHELLLLQKAFTRPSTPECRYKISLRPLRPSSGEGPEHLHRTIRTIMQADRPRQHVLRRVNTKLHHLLQPMPHDIPQMQHNAMRLQVRRRQAQIHGPRAIRHHQMQRRLPGAIHESTACVIVRRHQRIFRNRANKGIIRVRQTRAEITEHHLIVLTGTKADLTVRSK